MVDSGVGNVTNAARGLTRAGADVVVSDDPAALSAAERIVLPGVGSFPAAMQRLCERGLDAAVVAAARRGVPLLGICLGHQLLFDASEEFGETAGLGLLPGRVVALPAGERVPHTGWTRILASASDPVLGGLGSPWMYFVHSFVAEPVAEDLAATFDWAGRRLCAAARRGPVWGVQFHPEKSGAAGAALLANFVGRAA